MKSLRKIISDKLDLDSRLVAFYTFGTIGILLALSIIISLYGSAYLGLAVLLISFNNLPVFLFSRKKISFERACHYLIAHSAMTMGFSISIVGGLHGPVAYWLALLPLAAGLMLEVRGIVYGSVLALLALIGIALREFLSGELQPIVMLGAPYRVFSLCLFTGVIAFMAYLFLRSNRLTVMQQTRKLDNLLNIVSHDIANPLTLISGHAELLISQGQTEPRHMDALQRIARASDMINDILSKVKQVQAAKAGKLLVETSLVPLQEIFEKLQFIFEQRLQSKQQTLDLEVPDSLKNVRVIAEPVMLLNEVLSNFLSNAIKFSPTGSTILIHVKRKQDSIQIEVRDRGIGIPGSLLPHIFDDFRSTSRHGTDGEVGTGFGLPLANHIIEAFGGKLSVESRSQEDYPNDSGTNFVILLRSDLEMNNQIASSMDQ